MNIGISGKITSGKTTLRRHLERKYGFKGLAIADPIKRIEKVHNNVHPELWATELSIIVSELIPKRRGDMGHPIKVRELVDVYLKIFHQCKVMKEKNRTLLQQIGNETRKYYPTLWIDYAIKASESHKNIVIDDVRYINEAELLKSKGFELWRIILNPKTQRERILTTYGEEQLQYLNHASEIDLDDSLEIFDFLIDGSVTMNNMEYSADFILETHGIKEVIKCQDHQ